MKHEINKMNMINDIILTIALCVSITVLELITHVFIIEFESFMYFILIFVLIKVIYNGLSRITKRYTRILE